MITELSKRLHQCVRKRSDDLGPLGCLHHITKWATRPGVECHRNFTDSHSCAVQVYVVPAICVSQMSYTRPCCEVPID